ncbi:glycerate kinase family protein [Roseiconus lacunae]|uniref:Glycerate kinase n=1 Tax=Roseiconus lacunae TaxID=2605694 RepID=A0ABT7PQS7_9BACT|nr:glycerate kinase [Roseiconus lacunae]MCD0461385.1 glycerate kinase [Roseiconus lacunae]MDM4018686.1 glycerate kinase [Roseiconus lacunae]WRQ51453.1 glycerate kinase [Stieleria sp. HD01]
MNVLIVPDKFKGSLTASEVIAAIEAGLKGKLPDVIVHHVVASDGGDGFLDAIIKCRPSVAVVSCDTVDPLGRPIEAEFGFDESESVAYVEMARASGMELLRADERDPSETSTEGTGRLILAAMSRGAKTIYVGLGGSATNDGGCGIAKALGFRFFDASGNTIDPVGGQLGRIDRIDSASVTPGASDVRIIAVNDVSNPLLGSEGAAFVYAPQKGADAAMVRDLDAGLDHLQSIVRRDLSTDAAEVPGAGAAGGTGYGLKAFLKADFISGIEFVLTLAEMETLLAAGTIDLIVTGEGRIDDQTAYGKLVRGVADVGEKYNVPVKAICGQLNLERKSFSDLGLSGVVQIHRQDRPLDETIRRAAELVTSAAGELITDEMRHG